MRPAFLIPVLAVAVSAFGADAPPSKRWTGSAGAGLALTSGNTDTKNFNASAAAKYDPKTRFVFKAEALYLRGSTAGVRQVDRATADARGEYSLSDRAFAFGEVSYLRDPFKSITYLVGPVAGGGYRIIKSAACNLSVDGALGEIVQRNPAEGRTSNVALKAGQNLDWAISTSSRIVENLTGLWKTNDFADVLYHFDAGLTTTVASHLELKIAYAYDYKNRPVPRTLTKADSALFAAILFKF